MLFVGRAAKRVLNIHSVFERVDPVYIYDIEK